jgi:hypothetical protein
MVSAPISLTRKSGGFCIFLFITLKISAIISFEEKRIIKTRNLVGTRSLPDFLCEQKKTYQEQCVLLTGQQYVLLFCC